MRYIACAAALAVAFTVSLPQPAHADGRHTATRARQHPGARRGTRRSSWVTPSAPRTTSACPRALASPTSSSRRRPPCSTKTAGKSSPTSSAPTRSSLTLIQGGGRWHDSRHVAALAGHEHRLGQGAPDPLGAAVARRRRGAIAWLLLDGGRSQDGTDRWRHADADHLRPAAEHHWRARTGDGLQLADRRRQSGVCALHGRLLLLLGPRGRRRPNQDFFTTKALRGPDGKPSGPPCGPCEKRGPAWVNREEVRASSAVGFAVVIHRRLRTDGLVRDAAAPCR